MHKLSPQIVLTVGLFFTLCQTSSAAPDTNRENISIVRFSHFVSLYDRDLGFEKAGERFRRLEVIRKDAQNSLQRLMKQTPSNVELELRYGELILQRSRDLEQFALELQLVGEESEGKKLTELSRKLALDGLALHKDLLKRAPNHPLASQVYLGIARTQFSLGYTEATLVAANEGIKRLRNTDTQTKLNLFLIKGDASFDLSRAEMAKEAYGEAKRLAPASSIEAAYINYKLAWTFYNLKDPIEAIKEIDELFSVTQDRFALRQEAVQDYALFAADLPQAIIDEKGSFRGINRHLSRVSDTVQARRAMTRLGRVLSENGRRDLGIGAYEFLIADDKSHVSNVDLALTIVEWSHSLANKWKLTDRYHWLLGDFGPNSKWYERFKNRPEIQKTAYVKIEESLRVYSMSLHEDAQAEESERIRKDQEDVVAKLYDAYLESFYEEARIHYYRAEIFRVRSDWAKAGIHYDNYVRIIRLTEESRLSDIDKKLRDDAHWASVEVWAQAIEKSSAHVDSMLAASDRFRKSYPAHEKTPQVALDSAMVEFKSGRAPMALRRIEDLIATHPKTSQAAEGVNAALDILNKDGDYVNLALKARSWIDSIDEWAPVVQKTNLRSELNTILSQSEAKACETLSSEKGRAFEAALCLERYATNFRASPLASKSLLSAAELYDNDGRAPAALVALENLVKNYPESEAALVGFTRLAGVYEKNFEFEKAADIFLTLLNRSENNKDKERIASRLLVLNYGLGRDEQIKSLLGRNDVAETVKREFLTVKIDQDFQHLNYEIDKHGFKKSGFASKRAAQLFTDVQSHRSLLQLQHRLEIARIKGILEREAGRIDEADKIWMAGLREFWPARKSPAIWEAAARLRLEQGTFWEQQFHRTPLDSRIDRKLSLFQRLEKWYAEVIEMKSPAVALEAIGRSAELYRVFAEELQKSDLAEAREHAPGLAQKSQQMVQQLARRAKEWRIVSPVVLEAFAQLHPDIRLDDGSFGFPWGEMPRWMDLDADRMAWSEWGRSTDQLERSIERSNSRAEQRRASFVHVAKTNSLGHPLSQGWMRIMNERPDVQIRIQALINDGHFNRAQLYIEQYQEFFNADAFSQWAWGQLDWARGHYASAYSYWIAQRPTDDYRSQYWRMGWLTLMDEIVDGEISARNKKRYFEQLRPLAKNRWQEHSLANLCIQSILLCDDNYHISRVHEIIMSNIELPYATSYPQSALEIKADALANYAKVKSHVATSSEEISLAQNALNELNAIQRSNSRTIKSDVNIAQLRQTLTDRNRSIRSPAAVVENEKKELTQ